MEIVPAVLLTLYHVAFYWKFYGNPWRMATSEVVSNFFPVWLWRLRHPFRFTDSIYYRYPACIPFLSFFYWPLFALRGPALDLRLDSQFRLYSGFVLIHYLLGSFLAYLTLRQWFDPPICIFGAISLTYNAYNVKPFTPCHAFTSCWLMGVLLPWPWGAVSFGLAILGGYWPIIITFAPVLLLNPVSILGVIIALPQIIPTVWYFRKSVRSSRKPDPSFGRMPIKRFFMRLCWPENGVHYPEYAFGVGVCAVIALYPSIWWIFAIIGFIGSQGWFVIDRIPARFLYLVSFSVVMAGIWALDSFISHDLVPAFIIGQAILLWKNRNIYPHFPFCQWWRRPSEHSWKGPAWPNNTGYMNEEHHTDYFGGFALKENYRE